MLPLMKGRAWGRIINFGSASVFEGAPGQAHYVAAKAGIVGLTRSLAREVGDYGITVNVITPGLTVTKAMTFPLRCLKRSATAGRSRGMNRRKTLWELCFPGLAGCRLHHRTNHQRGRREEHALRDYRPPNQSEESTFKPRESN
jgi:hypothetical protein